MAWHLALVAVLLMLSTLASGQDLGSVQTSDVNQINELSDLIREKTAERDFLREVITNSGANPSVEDEEKLSAVVEDLESLRESLLFAVLGDSVNVSSLNKVVEEETTWQEDVVEILKPLADTLKTVTRRPREAANLREEIALIDQNLVAVTTALNTISGIDENQLNDNSTAAILNFRGTWSQEVAQLKQDKLLAESQLRLLANESKTDWSDIWLNAKSFLLGRGLTIILAAIAAIIVWAVMRLMWWIYSTKIASKRIRRQSTVYRLVAYSYYFATGIVIITAVLFTLWLREDLLLLAISFLALIGLVLGFRQYLPNYVNEARLLLNLGSVREDERVVYEGLPWQVMSLNIQSVLRNPALDGVIRLPLKTLGTLSSRPIKNNLWFPTKKGDFVKLPDGMFGRINCQTPDLVEISVLGGITITYPTQEFYSLKVLNFTGDESFGVSTTFGLDYSLQAISLTTVPDTLRKAVQGALDDAGYRSYQKSLLVELSSANESSLDYIVFVTVSSEIAGDYFKLQRLLVHTCVNTANANNWAIPFPQLTVHQPDNSLSVELGNFNSPEQQ